MFKIPPPSAPDCETKPMCPLSGRDSAKHPSILTSGSVFTTPKQLGPTHLIPYSCTLSRSCFSSSAPSLPVSLKPAVITQRPLMPFSWHWSIVDKTNFAFTTMIAKSISSGTSRTEVYACKPSITPPFGLIGKIFPLNLYSCNLFMISEPIVCSFVEAPTTAIAFGFMILSKFCSMIFTFL